MNTNKHEYVILSEVPKVRSRKISLSRRRSFDYAQDDSCLNHEAHEDHEVLFSVIPAHAGIYLYDFAMDSGLRRDDAKKYVFPANAGIFFCEPPSTLNTGRIQHPDESQDPQKKKHWIPDQVRDARKGIILKTFRSERSILNMNKILQRKRFGMTNMKPRSR